MLTLFLVRHAETDWNAQHRYQGHSDLPLNKTGVEQANQLANRIKTQKFDHVFSSDLLRSVQTAEILVDSRGIQIQTDRRLRELNFGILEGHTFEEGLARWPEMITAWVQDNNQPPENGERIDTFTQRVFDFYNELRTHYNQKTILIVSHGGPLRTIIQSLLPISERSAATWFNLDHASLTAFQLDDENVIVDRLNDTGHLNTR